MGPLEKQPIFYIHRRADLDAMAAKYARVEGMTLLAHTDTTLHYVLSKDGSHLIYRTSLLPQAGLLFGQPMEVREPLPTWLSMLTGYLVADLAAEVQALEATEFAVLQRGAGWCLLIDPPKPVYGIILFAAVPELAL